MSEETKSIEVAVEKKSKAKYKVHYNRVIDGKSKKAVKSFYKLKSEARPFAREMMQQGNLISLVNSKGTKLTL